MRSTLRSILAAAALLSGVAAATVAVPASLASAAACGDANGVTVVVDPQQLGGGVQEVCDAGGAGKTATALFEESGFHQSYAVNGGMVCRVNGVPASDPCRNDPPANAYWSLWWSDGTTGWIYASLGAGSLKVPAGGSVSWTWQGQSTKHQPAVAPAKKVAPAATPTAPAAHAASPTKAASPGEQPKTRPATGASPAPTAPATLADDASASASATSAGAPHRPHGAKAGPHAPSARPTNATGPTGPTGPTPPAPTAAAATATTDATAVAADPTPVSGDPGGMPGWIPPVIVAVLVSAAGAIAYARRRRIG